MQKKYTIVIVAAFLRILLFAYIFFNVGVHDIADSRDGTEYIEIAKNISQGNGYSICLDLYRHGIPFREAAAHPTAWRSPGYPFILAGIFKFDLPLWVIIIVQILIDLATLWIIMLFPVHPKISIIAGLLYAFSPQNIVMTSSITSETFLTFFLILGLYWAVKLIGVGRCGNTKQLVLTGIFLGCASLIHPYVLFLPFIIALFLLKALSRRSILIFLLSYVLILTPWVLRNYMVFHKPVYTSLSSIRTVLLLPTLFAPYNTPEYNELRKDLVQKVIIEADHLRKDGQSFENQGDVISSVGFQWFFDRLKQAKLAIAKTSFYSITRFFFVGHSDWEPILKWENLPLSYNVSQKGLLAGLFNWLKCPAIWFAVLMDIITATITLLGIVGCYLMRKDKDYRLIKGIFILVICYALIIFWPIGTSRYRSSITPYIFVFSGYGLVYLKERLKVFFHG